MKATRRRAGAVRLQALQAEMAAETAKPAKPLASYFSAPASGKTSRPKPPVSDALG